MQQPSSSDPENSSAGTAGRQEQTPRSPGQRPRLVVVPVMAAINVMVFLGWQLTRFDQQLQDIMMWNFTVSTAHLAHGRVWTLLTSAFSQAELWHLILNMVVLVSFGGVLERLLGRRVFLVFCLVAALVSSVSHCVVTTLMGRDAVALGASGIMSGLLLVFALVFPKERILVFGVLPVPALLGALAFIAIDIWGLLAQSRGHGLPIGHGAHLGGSLSGAVFYFASLRPRLRQLHQQHLAGMLGLSPEEQAELQRLRDKAAREGPTALTPKEQHFLQQLRQRLSR